MKNSRIQNQSYLRKINQVSIVSALKSQKMSCSALAKKTGLSNTAIANITDELVKSGLLIRENSPDKYVGRRPILMDINPDAALIAAVELAGKFVHIIVTDLHGGTLAEQRLPFKDKLTQQDLHNICMSLKKLIAGTDGKSRLTSLCISTPGKINPHTGYFLQAHRFRDCGSINLGQIFSQYFDCEIRIYNDIKLALSYERTYGTALSGVNNAMLLHIDHSVGSALLLNGQVLSGTNGFAGEIVNYTVNASATSSDFLLPKNRSAVKNMSFDSLLYAVMDALTAGEYSLITKLCKDFKEIDAALIKKAYKLGDSLTKKIMQGFISVWSTIIKNIAELLDLERILLSGAITQLGKDFKDELQNAVNFELKFTEIKIEFSEMHTKAAVKGAIDSAVDTAIKTLLKSI